MIVQYSAIVGCVHLLMFSCHGSLLARCAFTNMEITGTFEKSKDVSVVFEMGTFLSCHRYCHTSQRNDR